MKTDYNKELCIRYKSKGIIPDSNLLLLYFIGRYQCELIPRFKRTAKYSTEDFRLLSSILRFFNIVFTTPNILTEVSNLSNQLDDKVRPEYYESFKDYVQIINEEYYPSRDVSRIKEFNKLGLTDSTIIKAAAGRFLVLTDDFRLYSILWKLGIDAINMNHIRAAVWFGGV